MGWRPLNETLGRQICKKHWTRHENPNDSFNLFAAFGLRRPARISKSGAGLFAAGRLRQPRPNMIAAEPLQQQETTKQTEGSGGRHAPGRCRSCGQAREPGHTYCEKCSRERRAEKNRKRQKRHYDKVKNLTLFESLKARGYHKAGAERDRELAGQGV